MVYAAGYIAFKEPFLFALTDDLSSLHPCMNEYLSAISKGKLKCPQKKELIKFILLAYIFQAYKSITQDYYLF